MGRLSRLLSVRSTAAGRLAIGTGGGHIGVLIGTPFLTRLYGPATLGSYFLLLGYALLIANTGSLRYDLAIPLVPRTQLRSAILLPVTCCVAFALLLYVMAFVIDPIWFARSLGFGSGGSAWQGMFLLAPVEVARIGTRLAILRENEFSVAAREASFGQIGRVAGQVVCGFFAPSLVALVAIDLISRALVVLFMWGKLPSGTSTLTVVLSTQGSPFLVRRQLF